MTDFNSHRHNLAIRQEIGRLQLLLSRDAKDIPPPCGSLLIVSKVKSTEAEKPQAQTNRSSTGCVDAGVDDDRTR